MQLLKILFISLVFNSLIGLAYSQPKNKIFDDGDSLVATFSPGALLMGRLNVKLESSISYKKSVGLRLENLFIDNIYDRHIWFAPFLRIYPLTSTFKGFYLESDLFFRWRYKYSSGWKPDYIDWYRSSYGLRVYIGSQTFEGIMKNTPFDVSLGFNLDRRALIYTGDVSLGSGNVAPMSVLNLRIQTGIFKKLKQK